MYELDDLIFLKKSYEYKQFSQESWIEFIFFSQNNTSPARHHLDAHTMLHVCLLDIDPCLRITRAKPDTMRNRRRMASSTFFAPKNEAREDFFRTVLRAAATTDVRRLLGRNTP